MTCIDCGCDLAGSRSTRLRCMKCKKIRDCSAEQTKRHAQPEVKRAQDRAYNATRRAVRRFGYNCRKTVMVVDIHVADPWFISKNELELYAREYANTPGITVYVDGTPAAIQEILF